VRLEGLDKLKTFSVISNAYIIYTDYLCQCKPVQQVLPYIFIHSEATVRDLNIRRFILYTVKLLCLHILR
jgi:hypothetical protein